MQHLRDLIVARQSGIFEIDLRLRPHGAQGPLATSWEVFKAYYSADGQAADFERQALIKLRWVAGDADLGRRVETWRDGYVYSEVPFDLKAAVALRERQIAELVTPEQIDSKYSRGGLVDVEYTVQVLQLCHGAALPKLRIPSTLRAIEALRDAGVLGDSDAAQLAEAYRFLRRLIDAQRIVRGHARDLVLPPPESDEFLFLARRLGLLGRARCCGAVGGGHCRSSETRGAAVCGGISGSRWRGVRGNGGVIRFRGRISSPPL